MERGSQLLLGEAAAAAPPPQRHTVLGINKDLLTADLLNPGVSALLEANVEEWSDFLNSMLPDGSKTIRDATLHEIVTDMALLEKVGEMIQESIVGDDGAEAAALWLEIVEIPLGQLSQDERGGTLILKLFDLSLLLGSAADAQPVVFAREAESTKAHLVHDLLIEITPCAWFASILYMLDESLDVIISILLSVFQYSAPNLA
eukprot:5563524-Amphidinium_carterae.1